VVIGTFVFMAGLVAGQENVAQWGALVLVLTDVYLLVNIGRLRFLDDLGRR
jgi:hypothetical protein